MEYHCVNCDWSGTWDELILETMCPKCRGSVVFKDEPQHIPVMTEDGSMKYECQTCDWSGTWDEMILETLCPMCKGKTKPLVELINLTPNTKTGHTFRHGNCRFQ